MSKFFQFLKDWGVIGLAVAVIIGGKLNAWVTALVEDLMMPLIGLAIPGGSWREITIRLTDTSALAVGHFLGATIDFLIVSFVVYFFFTKILKNEQAIKALDSKKAG